MDIKEITQKVNRVSEELEKLRPLKSEDEQRVMQKFRLDWNYNSNNIEGNSLTYGETKALLLFGITAQGKPLKDHLEIEGHNEAIDYIVKIAQDKEPLTEVLIRDLHKIILRESYEINTITPDGKPTKKRVEIGKYKTTPNHVKTITGEIFYFTSPEDTPAKMAELIDWYKENHSNKKMHPLMFAVEFHHRFIRIHPFDDGNGRVVRLIMNLLLMQKELPPVIIKVKDKEEYYSTLQQADAGNLEPFYIFIGTQLIRSMELMMGAAKGESIEEADDVDKEIAILKQELADVEDIKIEKSKEAISKVLKQNLKMLFISFVPKLKSIQELYEKSEINCYYQNYSTSEYIPKNLTIHSYEKVIDEILNTKDIDEFRFIIKLIRLKKYTLEYFNDEIFFNFIFKPTIYLILPAGRYTKEIRKLYHKFLTEEELKLITRENKKQLSEMIKSKFNKN